MNSLNSTINSDPVPVPTLSSAQAELAGKRLALGIGNVGTWVVASIGVLWWLSQGNGTELNTSLLLWILALAILAQGVFDWIGGMVLIGEKRHPVGDYLVTWSRGALIHGLIVLVTGALTALSIQVTGFPTTAIIILSLWLGIGRNLILCLLAGVSIEGSALGLRLVKYARVSDAGFTGGSAMLDRDNLPLMAASWRERVPHADLETEYTRRQWQNLRGLPRRSWMFLLVWNVFGSSLSWALFDLGDLPLASALLGHAAGMTLWGFVGLLLLPSISRGSVFAADHAAAMHGHSIRSWIKQFPRLTGEDGSVNSIVQKIFYPIPSAAERIEQINNPISSPLLGNVARDNLFYSWSTLTFLGRAVHCNAGRPVLWVYPPAA